MDGTMHAGAPAGFAMAESAGDGAAEAAVLVSVLMVARNTGPFIGAAIASARAQRYRDIEIVVIDDGSSDDTRAIAERHAAADPRVRVLDGPRKGLAAVRNASLAAARGRYAAILDSDDLLHPDHVGNLLAAARRSGAGIVAANMLEFSEDARGVRRVRRFAAGHMWDWERQVRAHEFASGNAVGSSVVLGYLKPLFDMAFLRRHGLGYDPLLRIGEDFDLVFRAMLAGAEMRFLPAPSYCYRRHAGSTSAMTPPADLRALLASDRLYRVGDDRALLHARMVRRRSLVAALRMTEAAAALKALRLGEVWRLLEGNWLAWRMLARALGEAVAKRCRRLFARAGVAAVQPVALVIGEPVAGGALARRLEELAAAGLRVVGVPVGAGDDFADGLPEPAVVALADHAAAGRLCFALAPGARVIGADGEDCAGVGL